MLTRPLTIGDAVHRAVARGRATLLDLQHDDGRWEGIVRSDPGVTAQFLLATRYVGQSDPALERAMLTHLDRNELPGGGWAAYPGGPASLDVSLLCYAALRFAGRSPDSAQLRMARDVIAGHGAIEASGFVPRFPLVFWGQIPLSGLTYLSPKLLFMPRWIHPHLFDFGILLQGVVPVQLLLKRRAVQVPPAGCAMVELHSGRPHPPATMTTLGAAISRTSQLVDVLIPARRLDRRAADWLVAQQNRDGLWAGMLLFTTRAIMALHAIDPARYRAHIAKALAGMRRLQVADGTASWQQVGRSPVLDTAVAAAALMAAGVPADDSRLLRAAQWLTSVQTASGGWSFTPENQHTPDTDTTLHILEVLARTPQTDPGTHDALAAGIRWLLASQDRSGGWPMWPANWRSGRIMVREIDRAGVLAVSTPDVTARAVRALALLRGRVDPMRRRLIDRAVSRAVTYLRRTQRPDGAWPGRWAVGFAYGAAQGLTALAAAGSHTDAEIRARQFLLRAQRDDGGWGESPASDAAGTFVTGPSTVTQTSLALLGLLASPGVPDAVISRGMAFLIDQERHGAWDHAAFCQTVLPAGMYFQNSLFATSLAVMTLARATPGLAAPGPR